MPLPLADPFYYLGNFQRVLDWVDTHHRDLLCASERAFLDAFPGLPRAARALLVRMIMRSGEHFRESKLRYAEIGDTAQAAAPLIDGGWVDARPVLDTGQLAALLTRPELERCFAGLPGVRGARKTDMVALLQAQALPAAGYAEWCPGCADRVLRVTVKALCERLRLLFFGNLRQDWSEFVLTDLGVYRYEKVDITPGARAFACRQDVDDYLLLHRCRERLRDAEPADAVLADVPPGAHANPWLEARRQKLLFRLAMQYERQSELDTALRLHLASDHPSARCRAVRVLERSGAIPAAFELATQLARMPHSEAEAQQLARMLPRLSRALGRTWRRAAQPADPDTLLLQLSPGAHGEPVESRVQRHLAEPGAPVHYVENGLFNALFCLLCWDAIYAAVPGAFFHPFQAAPADLSQPDFHARRQGLFAACLARLDTTDYDRYILHQFRDKHGIQSPFLMWGALSETLLEQALHCLPASHLKTIFARMLEDVSGNRNGFPDLIQFWPREQRYRLIEVKGPGDRLQDNQRRWLAYFGRHEIPASVAYVQWEPQPQ